MLISSMRQQLIERPLSISTVPSDKKVPYRPPGPALTEVADSTGIRFRAQPSVHIPRIDVCSASASARVRPLIANAWALRSGW